MDLALLAATWLALVALVNPLGDFAANDDWVYGLAVQSILRDGSFALPSPATANVVLQAYWGALFCLPFGFSFTALRLSTVVLALFGLWAAYGMVREAGGSRPVGMVAALMLALNPMYLQLANTFMTDVPFVTLTTVPLWLFVRGIVRPDRTLVAASFAVALAAVMLRQFALFFVLGLGVAHVLRARFAVRSLLIAAAMVVAGLAAHLLFQHWLFSTGRTPRIVAATFGDVIPDMGPWVVRVAATKALMLLPYVGLMLAPLYLATGFASSRALLRDRRWLVMPLLLLVALQMAVVAYKHLHMPYFGNVLGAAGVGPLTLRDTYLLSLNLPRAPAFSGTLWLGALVLGIVVATAVVADLVAAAVFAIGAVARRRVSDVDALNAAVLVIAGLYGGVTLLLSIHLGAFDRYLLVLAAPLTLLVVLASRQPARPTRNRLSMAAVALLASALFAVPATHDYLAWQRARLAATDGLEAAGVPRDRIDGGYEYNGRYLYRANYRQRPDKSYWWVVDDLYVIASGPMPGYAVVARYPYARWLTTEQVQVVVLRRR